MNKKPMAVYTQKREVLTTDIFEPFRPLTNTERLLAYYRKRAMYESIQPAQVRVSIDHEGTTTGISLFAQGGVARQYAYDDWRAAA